MKDSRLSVSELPEHEPHNWDMVYICSPYSGDVEENTRSAIRYCRFAIDKGYMPIASHLLYPQILDDNNPDERKLGIIFGIKLLEKCREIWVFENLGKELSLGMHKEVDAARSRKITVRYFTADLIEIR